MKKNFRDFPLLESKKKYISLFYPHVSKKSFNSVKKVSYPLYDLRDVLYIGFLA